MTDSEIVTSVRSLWELMTPAADIARAMKLDQGTVLHIIKHGTLPARQRTLRSSNDRA